MKEDLMNGTAPAPEVFDGPEGATKLAFAPDPMLLRLAELLLDKVRDGSVSSLIAVTVDPNGQVKWPAAGLQAKELYLGLGLASRAIEGMVTQARPSQILRPGAQ
jgi:hypothetical protein